MINGPRINPVYISVNSKTDMVTVTFPKPNPGVVESECSIPAPISMVAECVLSIKPKIPPNIWIDLSASIAVAPVFSIVVETFHPPLISEITKSAIVTSRLSEKTSTILKTQYLKTTANCQEINNSAETYPISILKCKTSTDLTDNKGQNELLLPAPSPSSYSSPAGFFVALLFLHPLGWLYQRFGWAHAQLPTGYIN